ncbi:hypothetical protein HBI56_055370 [Parastagonospora nodorum]|nr:hypothetical protein HBH53_148360 [Parastagonospora nodorum]KAH3967028.1 hypothetical protein HBH51_139770 [Parastagonospora nodorum]KAH4002870.1 hypothetical protein HBI10_068350 [Parastagonospora nodorum]KAH4028064.1 hypothetical protein HBI13_049670 [Parastagonospora nodorum]KAH4070124.1 hypothetical protein HBH50_094340 [Parastagonospora nodorum]
MVHIVRPPGFGMGDNNKLSPKELNSHLTRALADIDAADVVRHFVGFPLLGAPSVLNEAAVVCLDIEWWQHQPKPTTELGIAELLAKGMLPTAHAENILTGIQVAHARIMPHAHLLNTFKGSGDPEIFHFGTTKFVTAEEAKQVVIDTFVRPRLGGDEVGSLQPIILIGHAVENEFEHIQRAFGVDLRSYGTVVKVIDTQAMATKAGIAGPKGPNIGLRDLLTYFNVHIDNLHTAGNDAAGTLMAAVLLALKDGLYPVGKPPAVVKGRNIQEVVESVVSIGKSYPPPAWGREHFCTRCQRENHHRPDCFATVSCSICRDSGVVRLYNAHRTHMTANCLFAYQKLPDPDHGPVKAFPTNSRSWRA